ncbi:MULTISPECIES: hypothetical protein [Emticicia]|uniref:hypothetical protein n=1 Tax=Emticicia TaxID=312278 RepID=UPI0007D8B956|nr:MULTISPECIES: hypothetical protein [Emticicia]
MENQQNKPMTMEEKQQLMRERLGRNIGKMYEKPVDVLENENLVVESPKIADKSEKKVTKGKEKAIEMNEKVWRIELKITSVKLIYKLEIISKMKGKSKQQYLLGLLEKDLVENVGLLKDL